MSRIDHATMRGILYTDQYQLTMAQLYYRLGLHEIEVQFDHYYRRNPDYDQHQAGYCVNAGMEWLLDWMAQTSFRPTDLEYMRGHRTSIGCTAYLPTTSWTTWASTAISTASASRPSPKGAWCIPTPR